jgi:hypothetical protein
MAITEPFELDGVTIGVTEWAITQNESFTINSTTLETTAGVYQLWVDASTMLKADQFRIKGYEKVEATGGAQKRFASWDLLGVQTEVFVTPTFILMNGWTFTLQKIAGTDRAFDAVVRKVA